MHESRRQAKDLVERKIAELRAQLKSVEARLARCESAAPLSEQDVQARVDETTATLRNLGESLGDAPPATLNRFLQVFISKLVVDLETRDVEVEIALPAHQDGLPTIAALHRLARESRKRRYDAQGWSGSTVELLTVGGRAISTAMV